MNYQANVGDLLSNLAFQVMSSRNLIFSVHLSIIENKRQKNKNKTPQLSALGESQDSAHATWACAPQQADGGSIIPTCAGALRGLPPQPGAPCASSGRWPASRSAASNGRRPPPSVTARCGGGWPYSGRYLSGTVPETTPRAPTQGPASGPAG